MNDIELISVLKQAATMSVPPKLPYMPRPGPTPTAGLNKGLTAHKAGKTQPKKRTWKKHKDAPKRPLSAYNLFFQAEREKILMSAIAASPSPAITDAMIQGNKRRHRKSHGKISFASLAQNIAAKWKTLSEVEKAPLNAKADAEKQRYKRELEAWRKAQAAKQCTDNQEQYGTNDINPNTTNAELNMGMGKKTSTLNVLNILSEAHRTLSLFKSGSSQYNGAPKNANDAWEPFVVESSQSSTNGKAGPSKTNAPSIAKPDFQASLDSSTDLFDSNVTKLLSSFDSNLRKVCSGMKLPNDNTSTLPMPLKSMLQSTKEGNNESFLIRKSSTADVLSILNEAHRKLSFLGGDTPQYNNKSKNANADWGSFGAEPRRCLNKNTSGLLRANNPFMSKPSFETSSSFSGLDSFDFNVDSILTSFENDLDAVLWSGISLPRNTSPTLPERVTSTER